MQSVNWVCEVFEGHEWVSELTIFMQDLDYELEVPCVVQWRLMRFSAPSRLNKKNDGNGTKIERYHEATNLEIVAAFSVTCGGFSTPRARA